MSANGRKRKLCPTDTPPPLDPVSPSQSSYIQSPPSPPSFPTVHLESLSSPKTALQFISGPIDRDLQTPETLFPDDSLSESECKKRKINAIADELRQPLNNDYLLSNRDADLSQLDSSIVDESQLFDFLLDLGESTTTASTTITTTQTSSSQTNEGN